MRTATAIFLFAICAAAIGQDSKIDYDKLKMEWSARVENERAKMLQEKIELEEQTIAALEAKNAEILKERKAMIKAAKTRRGKSGRRITCKCS